MKINLYQGETKIIDLLAVEEDITAKISSVIEVGAPTHTHEVTLDSGCFDFGSSVYLYFEQPNECQSGCYEIKYIDECKTTIGIDADQCLTDDDGTSTVMTCCGGVIQLTHPVGVAYKPITLKACDTLTAHVRAITSDVVRQPPIKVNIQAGQNHILMPRTNLPKIHLGAYVYIDGDKYLLQQIEERGKFIAVYVDKDFPDTAYGSRMIYDKEPITELLGSNGDPFFCNACGKISLTISKCSSLNMIPGVTYGFDVMAHTSTGHIRLGGGTIEVTETYTF